MSPWALYSAPSKPCAANVRIHLGKARAWNPTQHGPGIGGLHFSWAGGSLDPLVQILPALDHVFCGRCVPFGSLAPYATPDPPAPPSCRHSSRSNRPTHCIQHQLPRTAPQTFCHPLSSPLWRSPELEFPSNHSSPGMLPQATHKSRGPFTFHDSKFPKPELPCSPHQTAPESNQFACQLGPLTYHKSRPPTSDALTKLPLTAPT